MKDTLEISTADSFDAGSMDLPAPIFNHKPGEFRDHFNRLSFSVSHNLAHHPLFDVPNLIELASLLWSKGTGKVTFQAGDIPANLRWDEVPRKRSSVAAALRNIEHSDSWVLLKGVQEDPRYRAILESCFREIEEMTDPGLRKAVSWMDAYIFIASPRSVTPYHIDHECNFLLQICGEKEISIFDPCDRSVLTDEEIERYYVGDLSAATYKHETQKRGKVYHLSPGVGAHLPVRSPHWVKNGASFSVSLSVHFFLHSEDMRARVYQFNHYLRQLDIAPTPPARSALRDGLKVRTVGLLGAGRPTTTKSELLRRGVKRLDSVAAIGKRVLGRSTSSLS